MRQLIFAILTFTLWLSVTAQAGVKAEVSGRVLKISVNPYAPLKPYELWYQQRRDGDGDRSQKREFWLNYKTQHDYYSFKQHCEQSVLAGELNLAINLDALNDYQLWAKFNCLRLDRDALTMAWPAIDKFLNPEISNLKAVLTKLEKDPDYLNYKSPLYQVKADANTALFQLVNYMLPSNSNFDWYKSAEYRTALLSRSLQEFDKKPWAGHDPVITKPLVIVTHATTIFDNKTIKTFADANVQHAKSLGLPVVYLVSDDGVHDQTWYLADKKPDRAYFSKNGEHSVMYSSNTVVLMGGFYSQCLRTTQLDTITRHFLLNQEPLTIHLPVRGIYAHDTLDFTKITKDIFLARVKEGSILGGYEVDDNHGGMIESDMNKLTGIPDLKQYTVNIYADDQLFEKVGAGPRVVNLKFWSANQFWRQVH